jgi:hypothetical protein
MTVRHCPGCEGYAHGRADECPGMTMGEFETPDVVPSLRLADRLRALAGLPVFLGVTPDPPEDMAGGEPEYPDPLTSGMNWLDGRGP